MCVYFPFFWYVCKQFLDYLVSGWPKIKGEKKEGKNAKLSLIFYYPPEMLRLLFYKYMKSFTTLGSRKPISKSDVYITNYVPK